MNNILRANYIISYEEWEAEKYKKPYYSFHYDPLFSPMNSAVSESKHQSWLKIKARELLIGKLEATLDIKDYLLEFTEEKIKDKERADYGGMLITVEAYPKREYRIIWA